MHMLTPVELFGEARAYIHDAWHEFPKDKRGALLMYLAYHNKWVKRNQLAFLFWPDKSDHVARRNLRQLLNRIKPLAFYFELELDKHHIRWQVKTDLAEFEKAFQAQNWSKVLSYQAKGITIPYDVEETIGICEWLEKLNQTVSEKNLEAILMQAKEFKAAQDFHSAAKLLETVLNHEMILEDVLQDYIELSLHTEERLKAITYFNKFCDTLEREFGLEPLEQTKQLANKLMNNSLVLTMY